MSDSDSSVVSVHSDDSQLSFEFTEDNCNKRIEEFVQVTCTDSALAQYFLQDRKWNVVRAVNDYFKEMRKKEKNKRRFVVFAKKDSSSDEADDEDAEDSPEKKAKLVSTSAKDEQKPGSSRQVSETDEGEDKSKSNLFRHITWNIDGINEKNVKIRCEAVCSNIVKEKASFIFLQEVTPETEQIIRQKLSSKFVIFSGNVDNDAYYTLTLIDRKPSVKVESNTILNFKETLMGRNIIKTNVTINDVKLCLLNSHLESTKDGERQRIQQLAFMLRHIKTVSPEVTVIAGGDLNLRDKELTGLGGLPPGVVDAWVCTGGRKEVEFTWDMMRNDNLPYIGGGGGGQGKRPFKPRMRFDRLFLRKTLPVRLDIVHFGLVGLERLKPYVCFPSDHWGVITSYQIYNK